MAFFRNLLSPVAPGLPGSVNPLTFIGAGLASGNMGAAMTQMAAIQQQAQQQQANERYRGFLIQQAQAEMAEKQRERREAEELMERKRTAALQLLPRQQLPTEGPPTAAGEVPTSAQHTNAQVLLASAMPDPIIKAAMSPGRYLPIDSGKAGFFDTLTGQTMGRPPGAPAQAPGLTKEEFLSEFNAADYVNWSDVFAEGEPIGRFDPSKLQRRLKPTEIQAAAKDARQQLQDVQNAALKGNQVMQALSQRTGVGDVTAIIGTMQALDPGSVVSTAEQQVINQATGLYDNIMGTLQQIAGGGSLTETARQQLYDNMMGLLSVYQEEGRRIRGEIGQQLQSTGMPRSAVMPSPFNWPTEQRYPRPVVETAPSPERVDQLMQQYLPEPEF